MTALGRGRRAAERLMQDTFTFSRPTGGFVYDEATQAEVEAADELGTSVGKLQSRNLVAVVGEVGGRPVTTTRVELHLPVSAPALTAGDKVTLSTTGPNTPDSLTGRVWRVMAPVGKSWATAARYEMEEVVS